MFNISVMSQQIIRLCDDEQTTWTYTTTSNTIGQYIWYLNGNLYNSVGNNITVDWNLYSIGEYIITAEFLSIDGCQSLPVNFGVNILECDNGTMWGFQIHLHQIMMVKIIFGHQLVTIINQLIIPYTIDGVN